MRIVIDMQGAQQDWNDDSVGAVRALVQSYAEHDVFLALSGLQPGSIAAIRKALQGILSQEFIRVWHGLEENEASGKARDIANQLMYDGFLVSLKPDVVHYTHAGSIDDIFIAAPLKNEYVLSAHVTPKSLSSLLLDWQGVKTYAVFFCDPAEFEQCAKLLHEFGSEHKLCKLKTDCSFGATEIQQMLSLCEQLTAQSTAERKKAGKKRLANVSPLPPMRSGIADYCAELLPVLAEFYQIDVVVDQDEITSPWIKQHCRILSIEEFKASAAHYDRILYHAGNNPLHAQMLGLAELHPGVVVLHDFYLGDVQWHRSSRGMRKDGFWKELYGSGGYSAVKICADKGDMAAILQFPLAFSLFENAKGMIFHSEHAAKLARDWYSQTDDISVLPLLRQPAELVERREARRILGFNEDDFILCSFGFLGWNKLNHRLLDAWEDSPLLNQDPCCKLVFVGEHGGLEYGLELEKRIRQSPALNSVEISGWVDASKYRLFLSAADAAVQLRTHSRGETSAAVLDCMNYGLATIINANGAMEYISDDLVLKLDDDFALAQLTAALELLRRSPAQRKALGKTAQDYIRDIHDPTNCASMYSEHIERFYRGLNFDQLIGNLAAELNGQVEQLNLLSLSKKLSLNLPKKQPCKTLFLDVSAVARTDLKTGIQRVVRAILLALFESPPTGYRIEPVYISDANGEWHMRHARDYTLGLLNCPKGWIEDETVEPQAGDIFLGLDLACGYVIESEKNTRLFEQMMNRGVYVSFVVYDLLPVQFEQFFPSGAKSAHEKWLSVVATANSVLCISKAVATEFSAWVAKNAPARQGEIDVGWFHLGADLDTSSPSQGFADNAKEVIKQLSTVPSFLMVGTIEPRKGYGQALDAFSLLWADNIDVNLVMVGKEGWMMSSFTEQIKQHPEFGKRLFWLEGISDEYLLEVYANASCLLIASVGEGFGLPLIEAAQHQIPLLVRDIPVFREVAGNYAFYFDGATPVELAHSVQQWIALYSKGMHPRSDDMPWLTWSDSAKQLISVLIEKNKISKAKSGIKN
ncbi:glycosyltransferase [Rheinheimera sp.]|uniref:glycosyltransferase n=1 Tax=Rheinheimera sp. TaxID=1869214 RepID=UPI00307D5F3C